MNKYEALRKFLAERPRIRYFKKMVCGELYDAVKWWKADKFAPDVSGLSGLDGIDFVSKYDADYNDTVQHELAEIIELIDNFVRSHGDDIFKHYEVLKKYRNLTEEKETKIYVRL